MGYICKLARCPECGRTICIEAHSATPWMVKWYEPHEGYELAFQYHEHQPSDAMRAL